MARDTWFAQKGKRALGTKDVDFAILVLDANKYQALKAHLIKEEGFLESKINKYALLDRQGRSQDRIKDYMALNEIIL